MEFILIGLILIFIITYRNSSGEGVYKFVKDQAQVVYDQYAPYSYKVMREKIKELGLEYEIVEVFDDTLEAGIVKSQKPNYQENYQINANEKITLEVSKGQKTVKLPSKMVGKTSDEVRAELANLDIDFEIIEETSDVIEEGYVTAVEPEEGTEIPATTKVKVHVSTGTGIVEVTVPNLVNKKEDVAKATLEGLNLVANIEYIERF